MNAVELTDITKTFGSHTAVDGLSLHVPQGSIYGFIGPNGSGKTTTLRMIMNILYPDRGAIYVFGRPPRAASDQIGYLPEERGLYKRMRVLDLLRFYAELKGCRGFKAEAQAWLAKLGLADWGSRKVDALSKGMAQKVQFIAAVIARPELVILDEPFSGLDPVNMEAIRDEVLELKRNGATIIFSTHDMDVAEQMCDFIFMIFQGQKVLDGTLDDIQRQYGNDTLRVQVEGLRLTAEDLPGVAKVTDFGHLQELRLNEDTDPQGVLARLVQRGRVRHFQVAKPSLRDIFVRIAGPQAQEVTHA
ncbi:MAG: ATP-binding cassette domain-containing protein [Phycisphaerae bacterium]|nr:ATP-binding cassette domain-containing protein [Phycisphaerae bacterium]